MFNYGAPGYSRPPGYGGVPPGMAPPPGMGPPGLGTPGNAMPSAPGAAPPGVQANVPPQMGGSQPLPAGFPPPAGMPNINFSAPVIRLGTTGSQRGGALDNLGGGRRDNAGPARRGLGMDGSDYARRDEQRGPVNPPTREEIARTIFIGNIPEGTGGDEGVEAVLRAAGSLTRFYRATDASNKPQNFGFAEFADAQSLRTAIEVFQDVQLPLKRQQPRPTGIKKEEEEDEKVEVTTLLVVVDEASVKYAEDWTKNDDEATLAFRNDTARDALGQVIAHLFHPPEMPTEYAGDSSMADASGPDSKDVPFLGIDLLSGEDELADIPAEMREVVAAEIAAFRDRSIKRDLERLRREEEIEAEQRRRDGRRASPPISAPTGPAGANGVPIGPKADRAAPSGPKGGQFPKDYQGGVNFVNGGTANGGALLDRVEDVDSASDSELEVRRQKKKDAEKDNLYREEVARWLKHENRTVSSLKRTDDHLKRREAELRAARDERAKELKEFDDDVEAVQRRHLYFRDHGEYMRERQRFREREEREDRVDREKAYREAAARQRQKDRARSQADAFLDEQAEEMLQAQSPRETQQFKISLGAATKKLEQTAAPRRTAADVENLLEDEELASDESNKKRTLVPINFDAAVRANLTQEEVEEAQRQLARDIPNDKEGLWSWPISWNHLLDKHIEKDIKDWAAVKVLEHLGVQEDMLIDVIVEHLKKHGNPQDLVETLEMALDDEAESLVKKLWRMVIYYSETEKRGIK